MNTSGQERYATSNYIKEYFLLKNKYSNTYTCASGTVEAPSETRASIISVFQQKLRVFTSQENLSQMLSHSNFKMEDIGTTKTIVYIIILDEKSTYHPFATAFIKQCYEVLIDCATKNKGKLPVRTNFILDEFGNLPPIIDMTSIVSAARSRNIRLTMAIQSNKQLDSVYGESDAEVIKNNCNNLVFLYGRDLKTPKEISELCGNREEQLDLNVFETKPLITTSQLQHLKLGEVIFITKENYPYKAKLPDFSEYSFPNYLPYKYKERPNVNLERFDVQNFVKEKKKEKILSDIDSAKQRSGETSAVRDTAETGKQTISPEQPTVDVMSSGVIGHPIDKQSMSSFKAEHADLTAREIESDEQRSELLCHHYFMKAVDAYEMKDYATAERYFTKIYYLDSASMSDNVKNNLAYMKRRGETKSFSVPIFELLQDMVEAKDAFAIINLALCYINGVETQKNYEKAFCLIRNIQNNDQVLSADEWWSDSENCGEGEMKLVTFLLRAAGKVPGASREELHNRFVTIQSAPQVGNKTKTGAILGRK